MTDTKPSNLFNLTVALATVPPYIYLTCFVHEQAICSRLGIPQYLIEPNITTILIFATTIFGVLISCFKFLGFSAPLFKAVTDEKKRHLSAIYMTNGLCLVICIIMFYAYPLSWGLALTLLFMAATMNTITWALPLLLRIRQKKTVKEKLEDIRTETDHFDLTQYLMKRLNFQERIIFLIICLIPAISYFIGDGQIQKQKDFQTLYSCPNIVVLKKYNDLLVCSSFNRTTKTIGDSIVLIKISPTQPIILKTEAIGPLKLELKK